MEEQQKQRGPKYPDITVQLVGRDGNAFAILGRMRSALRKNGVEQEVIDAFYQEAMSGDYNHLLNTCMKWVNVE